MLLAPSLHSPLLSLSDLLHHTQCETRARTLLDRTCAPRASQRYAQGRYVRRTFAFFLLRERSSSSLYKMLKRTMLFATKHLHIKLGASAAAKGSLGARDVRFCVRWNA